MKRWLAAPLVAAVMTAGFALPSAAQECADFASQKEAQLSLEQVGDTGDLDLDLNGIACEQTLFGENQLLINANGPVTSDDETGESGARTVSLEPGAESTLADDGAGNGVATGEEEAAAEDVAEEPVATDEGDTNTAAAGDAAATDSPEGETAAAGDAIAVDTDDAEKAAPQPEKPVIAPAPEEPAAPEAPAAPEESAAAEAPAAPATTLPSTGVGAATAGSAGLAQFALVGLALAFALVAARGFRRA